MQKIPVGGALVYRMSRVVMDSSRRPGSPLRYSVVPGADMAVTSPPDMPETPTSSRRESRPCHAAVVAVFEITSSMFVQPLRLRPGPPPPPKSLLALSEKARIRTASKSVSRSHCRSVDVGFLSRTSSFDRREVELGAHLALLG